MIIPDRGKRTYYICEAHLFVHLIDLRKIAEEMSREDIILTYQGKLDEVVIQELLHFAETILKEQSIEKKLRKKIFIVLVESLQNSYKHQIPDSTKKRQSFTVALTKDQGEFHLAIGNYIQDSDQKQLEERLKRINEMSKDELQENYRLTLGDGVQSEKGGSGLGLMEIARKSGGRLEYEFSSSENGATYFSLQINILK